MRALAFTALVCLLAGPVAAQTGNCRAEWNRLNDLLVDAGSFEDALPGLPRQLATGGCRIDGVTLKIDDHISIATDRIEWVGTDMARFVEDGLPPRALSLRVRGISIIPEFGDKTISYLSRIQNKGRTIDLRFDAEWDESERRLSINALNLAFPESDHVQFSAEIEGIDLSSRNAILMSAGSMAVTRSVTDIRSTRLFQDYLLQPLGLALLYRSDDPEARVEELKEIAREHLATVPLDILPQASQGALLVLLGEMPDPSGRLRIEKTASPGIGPARFTTLAMRRGGITDPVQIWQALSGLVLTITYEPL